MKSRRRGYNTQPFFKTTEEKSIVDSHNFVQLSDSIKHNNSLVSLQLIVRATIRHYCITIQVLLPCHEL